MCDICHDMLVANSTRGMPFFDILLTKLTKKRFFPKNT